MASELEVGKIIAKTPATTGSSPLEVARLEVKDEGVNLGAGMGPKQSFYLPHDSASFEGASIAAKKEDGSDTHEATSLVFSTCPNAGTNTERLTIDSTGNVSVNASGADAVRTLNVHGTNGASELYTFAIEADGANAKTNFKVGVGGGAAATKLSISSGGHLTMASSGITIPSGQLLKLDGGGDTYIYEDTANSIAFATGGVVRQTLNASGLATFNNGIAFSQTNSSATGATATGTTLDHYEEGTWTPTTGGDSTYTVQTGRYTRVGRLVTATFDVTVNTRTNQSYLVAGLPFSAASGENIGAGGSITYYSGLAVSPVNFSPTVAGSTVHIRSATSAATSPSNHGLIEAGSRIAGIVTYTV